MGLSEELEKLKKLLDSESISEEEYTRAKNVLLKKYESDSKQEQPHRTVNIKDWCMFIHLSQFCGFFVPFAGFVLPIVLWQMKKDESSMIDLHGKIVVNWIISEMIYLIIGGILSVIVIGIPILIVLGVIAIIFPIMGAVKAGSGETWIYPLSIRFLNLDDVIE